LASEAEEHVTVPEQKGTVGQARSFVRSEILDEKKDLQNLEFWEKGLGKKTPV
jgi:hypothetical protein